MSEVLVSIKCMVYNHEPYLRQCLDGFVMQKTDFAFEAIVHDDASTQFMKQRTSIPSVMALFVESWMMPSHLLLYI